jgi:hypothetical protein
MRRSRIASLIAVGAISLPLLASILSAAEPAAAATMPVTRVAALGLQRPDGLAQDAQGDLFVTTIDGSTGRIVEFPHTSAGYSNPITLSYNALEMSGVAVDASGNIFVSEVLPAGGGYIVELAKTSSGYSKPRYLFAITGVGVAVDAKGDVFAAGMQGGLEELQKSTGKFVPRSIFTKTDDVFAVATDRSGDVYAAEPGMSSSLIEEFRLSGTTYSEVKSVTVNSSEIFDLAIGSSGQVFASDDQHNSVLEIAGFGSASPVVTTLPIKGLEGPRGVVPLKGRGIVVADEGNDRIVTSTAAGKEELSPEEPGLGGVSGIATDGQGNLYADCSVGVVKISATKTGYTTPTRLALSGALPTAIAVDSHGDIYSTSGTEVFESKLSNGRYGASVVLPFRDDGTLAAIAVTPSGSQVVVVGDQGAAVLELTAGASGYSAQTKLDFKGLSDATAIAVDSSGDVYEVDGGTAEILELPRTASGFGEQETLPIKGFGDAASIAVASNGDFFAAFEGSDEVGTPAVLVLLPRSDDGYGTQEQLSVAGLNGPTGLVVTPAGVLVISESDVQLDASVVALGQV